MTKDSIIPEGRYRGTITSMTKRRGGMVYDDIQLLDFVILIPHFDSSLHWTVSASHSIAALISIPLNVTLTVTHSYAGRKIFCNATDVKLLTAPTHPESGRQASKIISADRDRSEPYPDSPPDQRLRASQRFAETQDE